MERERVYFNSTKKGMRMEEVANHILDFIKQNPNGDYKVMVGTDSQLIGQNTCFATGIVVHRTGKGAWCCVNKTIEPRRVKSLSEKIHMETSTTYSVIMNLNELVSLKACEMLLTNKDLSISVEAHIDVGKKGATRTLIREMVGYFEGVGIIALIKPYSYVASTYANKYSKHINDRDLVESNLEMRVN